MVSWTEDFFGESGKTGVCWECFYCPWRMLLSLASNSRLFIEHVRYAPAASLRAEWEIGSIIFLMELLAEL